MFPFRDHNPSERTPYVTYALIALNIGIFASYWPLFNDAAAIGVFFQTWGMQPVEISAGVETYTLFTSMFLHGGLMHLAGNMLFLWIFGDNLEDQMGHFGFALFYLAAGVAADFGQLLAAPDSAIPVVGASGAIAGIMGGYLLLFPRAKVDIVLIFIIFFKVFSLPAWVMLGVWFALQLFNGVASLGADGAGVAYWAHAGGFVVGLLLCLPLWLKRGGAAYWRKTEGHPPHPDAIYGSTLPVVKRRK
ncbi:MAG: rhomboid family intramembrane serine protease [Litoreibacter sp.]|uniref:rhomboid family intramembrane serine protease n=1 Tax=Litoreibacter sp. TaxID=1969459 RepID=UPI0032997A3B